jgi:ABC-type uncharacterized transport system substrate-binding protein
VIGRREFITLMGGTAAWPLAARAQQRERMRRVGILMPYPPSDVEIQARVQAFREELIRLGWSKNDNIQFDERWTTDNMDLVRAHATNLVELRPDAILALGGRVIPVLMHLTQSIPIIVPGAADPVGTGWVESLARPGGNVTGFTNLELSSFGKMLEFLKQIAPSTVHVAVIYNPDNPNTALYVRLVESFAKPLALQPLFFPIHRMADIDRAVTSLVQQPGGGAFFPTDLTITQLRDQITALLAQRRVPAIYSERAIVKSGGLLSYDQDRVDLFRRSTSYVDRLLRGEKPGDLPFQQPTKYDLTINLKTAKALGLDVPPTLLARADEIIE